MTVRATASPGRVLPRAAEWIAPLVVTILAALLRLPWLNHPHALVFDETYYVKDAWSLLHLGYEGSWPEGANEAFLAGDTGGFLTDPSFVVHPPLGKWIIAAGMAVFGADSGWGWRIATALIGTATVLLLYLVARRLSGSVTVGAIAAGLMAIDGLAISMSRVALLDGILAFFVLLAFLFLVIDRERTRGLFTRRESGLGPVLWRRPWIITAGAALGAAAAVKWSALYVLAGVGISLVVADALARRRAGVKLWYADAVSRQGPVLFALLVPVALVVYLASWTGWFVTSGGYDRGSDPNPLIALWNYHSAVYGFHVGLSTGHPYASPAWQWPMLLRPTAMWTDRPDPGTAECAGSTDCIAVIGSLPNPVVWYAGMIAIVVLAVLAIRLRDGRYGLVLTGVAVTYLPWLLYPERTMFQFYTVVMLPFVLLALALMLQYLCRSREPALLDDPTPKEIAFARREAMRTRFACRTATIVFLAVAVLVGLFFLPLSTGIMEPYPLWRMHMWLGDSWI